MHNVRIGLISALLVSGLSLGSIACGGSDQPAKAPENTSATAEGASAGKEDMPAPPAKEGEAATAPAAPATPSLKLPASSVKLTLEPVGKDKKKSVIELAADGNVTQDGKPFAKLAGSEVSFKGKPAMSLMADNSIITPAGTSFGSFSGDDLSLGNNGGKLTIGSDGAITLTGADGKAKPLGKAEGVGDAKRAILIVAALTTNPSDGAGASDVLSERHDKPASTGAGAGGKGDKPTKAAPKK
ncbi:hypothetical protein [Labilithrix luteola]|nr:hypothetical protein [Labilithrix luteola]